MQPYLNDIIQSANLPAVNSITFEPMASEYRWLSVVGSITFWILIIVPLTIANHFVADISVPFWIFLSVFFIATLSCIISYYSATAKGFTVRERDILYKEGIFWRKTTGVSFKRIQHIDLTHGPLERKFNIASIKLFTAGGASADLRIPGLAKDQAESLRTLILEKTGLSNE